MMKLGVSGGSGEEVEVRSKESEVRSQKSGVRSKALRLCFDRLSKQLRARVRSKALRLCFDRLSKQLRARVRSKESKVFCYEREKVSVDPFIETGV